MTTIIWRSLLRIWHCFFKSRSFYGLNVTNPYKQVIIPYLDQLEPQAKAIGAVNTVVNRNGKLWGFNTDFGGMADALCHLLAVPLSKQSTALAGKTAIVLGTGGTSRTAVSVCTALGTKRVLCVSRRKRGDAITYEKVLKQYGTQSFFRRKKRNIVLINCTPVGMFPDLDSLPLHPAKLLRLFSVFDCVYNPLRTRLVQETKKLGLPAGGGLEMLIRQAAFSCGLFTGFPVEESQIIRILNALRRKRESLVLIGMPGSGKSTIGYLLAKTVGKPFVDLDSIIEARAGKSVAAIFTQDGEDRFRDLETELVREVSKTGGNVLAPGGGTILRDENLRYLRQNGRLIFLDRPLETLFPSPNRPLANTEAKLCTLYQQRHSFYTAVADCVIPCIGTVSQTLAAVQVALERLYAIDHN